MSKTRKRLAIFLPALSFGGAQRTMVKLAGGIAERGYAVDMVLARAEGPLLNEVSSSVRVVNLKAKRDSLSLLPLVSYLRRRQPDALLSGMHTNIIALLASRLAHVSSQVVVSERTTLSKRVEYYATDWRMWLLKQMVKKIYPWAASIVAVSHGVANDLIQEFNIPKESLRIIYNPIITDELRVKAKAPLEHPWFRSGERRVILAVGRLTPPKDFCTLITAFAQVAQFYPSHLLILGDGEERSALENLIRSLNLEMQVSMPGFIANPYPYMGQASVFVQSSRWEGLPGALIEAMYCGAPLIATDCPSGPREILADGKYGRLVPVGNADALAKAICDALAGKVLRPSAEGWKRFEMEFVVNQYMELLFGD